MAVLWSSRLLALLGFLDATYLTVSHYTGSGLACGPGGGCGIVTASRFATVGGVPIAAIGSGYYVLVNLLVWTRPGSLGRAAAAGLLLVTASATVVSGVLVVLQAAVIHAWCRFCLLSSAITLGLFLCAVVLHRSARSIAESDGAAGTDASLLRPPC